MMNIKNYKNKNKFVKEHVQLARNLKTKLWNFRDFLNWSRDKTDETRDFVRAPYIWCRSVKMPSYWHFNIVSSNFVVALAAVHHLCTVALYVVSPVIVWTSSTKCSKVRLLRRRSTTSTRSWDFDERPSPATCPPNYSRASVPVIYRLSSSRRPPESLGRRASFQPAETSCTGDSCMRDTTPQTCPTMICLARTRTHRRQKTTQSTVCWTFCFWIFMQ